MLRGFVCSFLPFKPWFFLLARVISTKVKLSYFAEIDGQKSCMMNIARPQIINAVCMYVCMYIYHEIKCINWCIH